MLDQIECRVTLAARQIELINNKEMTSKISIDQNHWGRRIKYQRFFDLFNFFGQLEKTMWKKFRPIFKISC
jgi:hypothetical protein